MLSRRNFCKVAGAIPATTVMIDGSAAYAGQPLHKKGPVIESISLVAVSGNFSRFVGMNAYDTAPKGIKSGEELVIVKFSDDSEGISVLGYSDVNDDVINMMRALVGQDPHSFYEWKNDRIVGVTAQMKKYFFDSHYAWIEGAMLDALAKQRQIPVWKLFSDAVRDGIDVYDGALYFEDIARQKGVDIIASIARQIKDEGYRGIKIKLGRPSKWMTGEAGVQRDIDAFIALREAVGWNFSLMADANNGYENKFNDAVRLMKACAPYNMYWMEELFPDDTVMYKNLREILLKENLFIPIAEGESLMGDDDPHFLNRFDKYLDHGVYNFLQPDMRTHGFSNMIHFSKKALKYPHVKIAPHNWNSHMGMIMSLHAAKICSNIPVVEDDRFINHAIALPTFNFEHGQYHMGSGMGWGVELLHDYKKMFLIRERKIA